MKRFVLMSLLAGAVLAPAHAAASQSQKLVVDDDKAQCPQAQYTTIQSAVDAAHANDTISVCPGTYSEQVKVTTHAKDGLKILATKPLQATIQSPAVQTSPKAIVLIDGADKVTFGGFTVTGPFTEPGCGTPIPGTDPATGPIDVHKGVYVRNGAKEIIAGNHITKIQNSVAALFGCQDGIAVQVGRMAENAVASALIAGNVIDDYQKGGVTVDNAGSLAVVSHNVVKAAQAVQPNIAPNGIQISRGAGAEIDHNKVSQNKYLGDPNNGSGSGILLFNPGTGKVSAEDNESFSNDDNLPLIGASRESIKDNYVHDAAIYDGIFADSASTGNAFTDNTALRNTELDCNDQSTGSGTAGTANSWRNDTGVTQSPMGICRPPKGKDGHGHSDDRSRMAMRGLRPADSKPRGAAVAPVSAPAAPPAALPITLP